MAKKKKKKLEQEQLENKTAFYAMITALTVPVTALIDLITWLLKHFLK